MTLKTNVRAEEGKQEVLITREFDLPVELLFKAHAEAGLLEQWMGTNVLKLDARDHGSYQFETTDPQGNVVFRANGTIHEFRPNERITRTFEMEHTPFAAQLEFFEFEKLSDDTSRLKMHLVFKSISLRDELLKQPFAEGLNMAHNRLQEILSNPK